MEKDVYTNIRNKNRFTIEEVHLVVNKYRNIISNLSIKLEEISDMFATGKGGIVQQNLPNIFAFLDKHYHIISIIDKNQTVLKYITNNHTTENI